MNKEFLSEEKYQKNKKKISMIALIILVVGLLIGGALIITGINNSIKINSQYSEENKQSEIDRINKELDDEKLVLETKKKDLQDKGVTYDAFTDYDDKESYDLKIISKVLDPSFSYCSFDEYKNNSITSKYCSLKVDLQKVNSTNIEFEKRFNSSKSIPFFMFGGFIIVASCMISFSIYMITKRREITAFTLQQVMPVAQEGMEKMAPTIGKVGKTIGKEMAPVYGEVAKEISKGIKEGLKKDK